MAIKRKIYRDPTPQDLTQQDDAEDTWSLDPEWRTNHDEVLREIRHPSPIANIN